MLEKGVPIRSVSRSIAALQAINYHGGLSMMEISQEIGLPYATTMRLVQTLIVEGFIEREPDRKRYRPTMLVHTLSHGFHAEDRLVKTGRPHIVALTGKISWPTALSTRVGQRMMVRASTHALTALTFANLYPGHTLPVLECSAGRCYLAFCPDEERRSVLEGMGDLDDEAAGSDMLALFQSGAIIEEIRNQKYAVNSRTTEALGKTSSIAVPLFEGETLVGSLTAIYFTEALKTAAVVGLLVDDLHQTARDISAALAEEAKAAA